MLIRRKPWPLLTVVLIMFAFQSCSTSSPQESEANGSPVGLTFEYPEEWKSSLDQAQQRAEFNYRVPEHAAANRDNATEIFMNPAGTVFVMRFPSPHEPDSQVRQDYLELYEEPWQGKLSPEETWRLTLKEYPGTGEIVEVEGVEVLVGKPHGDETGQNPAHIRFVMNGVDIEIFGNDDSDLLVEIAKTMLKG